MSEQLYRPKTVSLTGCVSWQDKAMDQIRNIRGPKDHISMRILSSCSKPQDKEIPEVMVGRMLMFMSSFGRLDIPTATALPSRGAHLADLSQADEDWVAVKEFKFNCHNSKTILFTTYP